MEAYLTHLSAVGSALSMAATLYFWLVRMRQERACLKPHLVDHEYFLGQGRGDVRQLGLKVGVLVANYSVLPNAILGARLWVRLREGWQEVERLSFDKQTPQPFNIPPLQTVLLRLSGVLSFPYQDGLEEGSKTTANYVNEMLAQPLQFKLELQHLNDRTDVRELTLPRDQRSEATRPLTVAA